MTMFNRRALLKAAGVSATAVVAPSLLSACSGGPVADAGNAGKDLADWPAYVPFSGPTPDAPGDATGLQPLYKTYPAQLAQSVKDKVGDGSDVTAVYLTYGTPPTPVEQNKLWQELNKALGVNLKLTVVPAADWAAKIATITASGDLPDIIMSNDIPRKNEFILAQCADLSEFLSGDAIKAYPNLANIPTVTWQKMGRIGGRIYGVPVGRPLSPGGLLINKTAFDAAGVPKQATREQFLTGLKALSGNGRYGTSTSQGELTAYGQALYYAASEGVKGAWVRQGDKFVPGIATEQFKAAVETYRKAVEQGSFHPDSLSKDTAADFLNGTVASKFWGFGGYSLDTITKIGGRFEIDYALPYGSGANWQSGGIFGFTVFKKAPADRIKLLLRICDYLAAPFGTKEYELSHYGIEGVHFTRDAAIGIKPTDLATTTEVPSALGVRYISDAPWPIFIPGQPEAAQRLYDFTKATLPASAADPSVGLISASWSKNAGNLNKIIGDGIAAIGWGRRPVSDLDTIVKDFNANGGAAAAEEFAMEYAAAQAE
ncbi:type 2 periplasmic-binding domain-containing protein [Catellatospora vulcania]|uniref:extracellular solute-binding protein n=1 Tax=Catellatospora vulcania TaxID=1460450 RepID=UPI0012D47E32|nr:extracellular solute-binding protein [Catellatospora vulcania]